MLNLMPSDRQQWSFSITSEHTNIWRRLNISSIISARLHSPYRGHFGTTSLIDATRERWQLLVYSEHTDSLKWLLKWRYSCTVVKAVWWYLFYYLCLQKRGKYLKQFSRLAVMNLSAILIQHSWRHYQCRLLEQRRQLAAVKLQVRICNLQCISICIIIMVISWRPGTRWLW